MEPKLLYRNYRSVRNFAEHRCHRVPNQYNSDVIPRGVYANLEETCTEKYTYNSKYFFFEKKEDAFIISISGALSND